MANRKRQQMTKRDPVTTVDAEDHGHAPQGRGGAAMGRTVGLPFGGGRPRKRRAKKTAAKK